MSHIIVDTDGAFNFIGFSDPVLDETLAEDHDKNMFDEHLGLKKESDEFEQSSQIGPAVGDENVSAAEKPTVNKPKNQSDESVVSAASADPTDTPTESVAQTTPKAPLTESPITSKSTDSTISLVPKSGPPVPPSSSQSPMPLKDTVKTPKQNSPASASPKSSSGMTAISGGAPSLIAQTLVHTSPSQSQLLTNPSAILPSSGSPHPGVSNHPIIPGSPHPGPHNPPHVAGSPHPGVTAYPLIPSSPHPGAATYTHVPGSPHPGASSYPLVPGSPHPSSSIASSSPHSSTNPVHHVPPASPHGSLVSGSPHHQMTAQSPGTSILYYAFHCMRIDPCLSKHRLQA